MNNRRRLLDNLLSLAAVRVADYLIPLVTLPYLVRVLGLEHFGLINFALSLSLFFAAVMQYGFAITAVRKIARNRSDDQAVSAVYSETLTASFLLIVVCSLPYFALVAVVDSFREHVWLYVYSFLFVAMQTLFPLWFFQGVERMRQSAIISVASKVGCFLAVLWLVREPEDYYKVPGLNALAMSGCVVFSIVWISWRCQVRFQMPDLINLVNVYREGKDAFLSQLAPNLYNNAAVFSLGIFGGAMAVGVFSAASQIVGFFSSIGIVISNSFFPFLTRKIHLINRFHLFMILAGLVLSSLCFLFSDEIVNVLFSSADKGIGFYVRLMSVSIFFVFCVLSYHNNGLMVLSKDDSVRKISVWTSVLFFCLGVPFTYFHGIYGAVFMVVGGRGVMALWGAVAYRSLTLKDR